MLNVLKEIGYFEDNIWKMYPITLSSIFFFFFVVLTS